MINYLINQSLIVFDKWSHYGYFMEEYCHCQLRKTNTPYQPMTFSCVTAHSCTYTSEHMFTHTHTFFFLKKICIYHKIWRLLLLLLLFFVCLSVFLRQGLIMLPWLSWNSMYTAVWSWTHRTSPVLASWVLGSKVCATMPD